MSFTVKKLAELSGVSVRTLHWYDEVGLLKPAFIGANGYRYYKEEQLLILQQVLFFKELGFNLNDIQNLMAQKDFDKIRSLHTHKQVLVNDIDRENQLIETIDKTIMHLRGKKGMSSEELYRGFDKDKHKEYEQYIVKYYGTKGEDLLFESKKRTEKWGDKEWRQAKDEGDLIHKDLAKAIDSGLSPESEEVQRIIRRHFEMQGKYFDLTKDVYTGLADLYKDHPDFKKYFDVYHKDMIPFIGKAIKYFAEKNL